MMSFLNTFGNITCSHSAAVRRLLCARFSLATSTVPVDKSSLSKLRKHTGYAFSNCRKALVLHNNNFDQALEWLNAEAAKEGWAKASKLQNRPMSQGVIGVIANTTDAFLLQVNCETDFVARNVQFLELVSHLTNTCYEKVQSLGDQKLTLASADLGSMMLTSSESVADAVAKQVGTLGENLSASRAVYMSTKGVDSYLGNYVHTAGVNPKYLHMEGCSFGKFASFVRLSGDIYNEDIALNSNLLAQHIVGINPQAIGSPEDPGVAPKVGTKAKDVEVRSEEDSVAPEATEGDTEDEEPVEVNETRLLYQEFLLNPDLTTRQWLEERKLSVMDYIRISVSGDDS